MAHPVVYLGGLGAENTTVGCEQTSIIDPVNRAAAAVPVQSLSVTHPSFPARHYRMPRRDRHNPCSPPDRLIFNLSVSLYPPFLISVTCRLVSCQNSRVEYCITLIYDFHRYTTSIFLSVISLNCFLGDFDWFCFLVAGSVLVCLSNALLSVCMSVCLSVCMCLCPQCRLSTIATAVFV